VEQPVTVLGHLKPRGALSTAQRARCELLSNQIPLNLLRAISRDFEYRQTLHPHTWQADAALS